MKNFTKNYIQLLRQNTTDAEDKLWYFLRAKRLKGYKFRRQHAIYPFIVDFICLKENLIVELDGGQHEEQKNYDEVRTTFLTKKGYKLLRFWNNEVFENIDSVLEEILRALRVK